MSYQRSKAPLSLMEQLIMVFVFAFAAAICLQAFVYSDNLSKTGTAKETAAMRASEVIEVCKAYHGDLKAAADRLKGTLIPTTDDTGDSVERIYEEDGLRVLIDAMETITIDGEAMSQSAKVYVYEITDDGESNVDPIYETETMWQLSEQTAG